MKGFFQRGLTIAAMGVVCLQICPAALAWNAHGHRIVARLAIDELPADVPAFLRDPGVIERAVEESGEPDRWRSTRRTSIQHEDNQDHYLDVEDLAQFGLALQTLPRYRYEFVRAMALSAERHPELLHPHRDEPDPDKIKQYCGFLPHAIMTSLARLQSSFQTIRILERLNDPSRAAQLELAKQNAIYQFGILAHFVGDASEPLHLTIHHHGWVGENPNAYTTDHGFHAYVDGTILDLHSLTYESVRDGRDSAFVIDAKDPWPQTLEYLQRSLDRVEPLYKLQKSGGLTREEGKAFISGCLRDGGRMLAGYVSIAWSSSSITDNDVSNYIKYNEFRAGDVNPEAKSAPAPSGDSPPAK